MTINKLEKYGLITCSILFLILYFILSFNIRFAVDDFIAIALINEYGAFGAIKYLFLNWTGRWSGNLYFNFIYSLGHFFSAEKQFVFLYYLSSILIFVYAIYSIFTSLIKYFFEHQPPVFIRLSYAILFCAAFYFSTFLSIEVWFWIGSSFSYLQSIIFSSLGVALILNKNKFILKYFLIALCFQYVGGAAENHSLSLLIIFSVLIFYFLQKNKFSFKELINHPYFTSVSIAFVFLLMSSSITYFSAGNFQRLHHDTAFAVANPDYKVVNQFGNSISELIIIFFQKKYLTFLLLLFPFILLGLQMKLFSKKKTNSYISIQKLFIISVLIFALFFTITSLISFSVFRSFGPIRSWASVNFIITILFCFWSFILGYKTSFFEKNKILLPYFYIPLMLVLLFYIFKQYPIVTAYSSAYDKRINYLYELKKQNIKDTVIFLEPLPDPGMLVYGEPTYLEDFGFEKALGLKFKVRTKEK